MKNRPRPRRWHHVLSGSVILSYLAMPEANANPLVVESTTTVASIPPDPHYTPAMSLTLDAQGLAAIAYLDGIWHQPLRWLRCQDHACTSVSDVEIDADASYGTPSIAFDASGNPAILYRRWPAGDQYPDWWLALCSDPNCTVVRNEEVVSVDILKGSAAISFDHAGRILVAGRAGLVNNHTYLLRVHPDEADIQGTMDVLIDDWSGEPTDFSSFVHVSTDTSGFPVLRVASSEVEISYKTISCLDPDCTTSDVTEYPLHFDTYSFAMDPWSDTAIHAGSIWGASAGAGWYQRCLVSDCSEISPPVDVRPNVAHGYDVRTTPLPSGAIVFTYVDCAARRIAVTCDDNDVCRTPVEIEANAGWHSGNAGTAVTANGDVLYAYVNGNVAEGMDHDLKITRLTPAWSSGSFCERYDGETVTLWSSHGRFVSAGGSAKGYAFTQEASAGADEQFVVECDLDGSFALRTSHDLYLQSLGGGAPASLSQTDTVGTTETWWPHAIDGKWAFSSDEDRELYIRARPSDANYLVDLYDGAVAGWKHFQVTPVP